MANYPNPPTFLKILEERSADIIHEVESFEKKKEYYIRSLNLTTYYNKGNAIGNVNGWNQIRFICQSVPFLELMEKYNLIPGSENPGLEEFKQFKEQYKVLYTKAFPITSEIIHEFHKNNQNKLTNIAIYRLVPGALIPVHTNFDPHMYRCHMGLVVPEGDVGFMVEGEQRQWEVSKFFAFDSTRPHTAWNKSKEARYVLSIDCYRPDIRHEDAVAVHKALVNLRMEESKLSLGLSGGRSDLDLETRNKYASEHELVAG